MADELAWRKFPRNAARDENLDYIAYLLGDKAPQALLFFTIMYCICDDDGVFDLEDGIIFSRMMKTGTPEDVFNVASLMEKRRIIVRCIDHVYMIRNWDAPQRTSNFGRAARTMEERRAAVAKKIAEERRKNPEAEPDDFFCLEDDKNANFVVTQREREKERQTDRPEETERTQREENLETERKETHTEGVVTAPINGASTTPSEENARINTDPGDNARATERQGEKISTGKMLASMAAEVYEVRQHYDQEKRRQLLCQLNDFFAKNCLGYEWQRYTAYVSEIADRISKLATEKNPAKMVAAVMTSQFLALSQNEGHYKGVPLTPEYFLKAGVYAHVLNNAGRILLTKDQDKTTWQAETEKYMQNAAENHVAVDNWLEEECLKYDIDPHDPQRQVELMRAKAAKGMT